MFVISLAIFENYIIVDNDIAITHSSEIIFPPIIEPTIRFEPLVLILLLEQSPIAFYYMYQWAKQTIDLYFTHLKYPNNKYCILCKRKFEK